MILLNKKLQSVNALFRSKHPEAETLIADLLDRSDIHSTYFLLSRIRPMLRANEVEKMFNIDKQKDRFGALVDVAKNRHGDRAKRMAEAFAHSEKIAAIVSRRALRLGTPS